MERVFNGVGEKTVKYRCTACEGRGWVPFIDLTEKVEIGEAQVEEEEELEEGLRAGEWRKEKGWSKAHYFVDGRSLCGGIHMLRGSTGKFRDEEKCITCRLVLVKQQAEED